MPDTSLPELKLIDPNGFTNALAAGMKMREVQNASNRLAAKDEAAVADKNSLSNYLSNPRTPEADRALAAANPEGYLKAKKAESAAANDAAQARNNQLTWAKGNHELLQQGAATILANPTREIATMVLDNLETQHGGDMTVARKQLQNAPDSQIADIAKIWGMNAQQIAAADRADKNANKPVWDSYTGQYRAPPGSPPGSPAATGPAGPTTPAPPGTVVQGGELPPPDDVDAAARHRAGQGPPPTGNVDYEGLSDEGLDELRRTSSFSQKPAAPTPPPAVPPAPPVSGQQQTPPVAGPQTPPVGGQPAPKDGPQTSPVAGPPPQVYRSPAERYAARDAVTDANTKETQRVANETLDLKKSEAEAKERRAREKRTQPTPQAAQKNREKLQTLDIIDTRLDDVEAAFMGPKNPDGTRKPGGIEGSFSVGLAGGYLPTAGGRGYDATVDALRPFLRQISRTPGEGAMSDYETKQAEALLPARNDHPSVVKQKILQIRNIVKQSRLGIAGSGAPAAGPAAPGPTPVQAAPLEDLNDMPLPGGKYKGKWVKDPSSGIVYRSDGSNWIKQ